MFQTTLQDLGSAHEPEPLVNHPLADRLLTLQTDIWSLEAEAARIAALLRTRRAARQHLARQARRAGGLT